MIVALVVFLLSATLSWFWLPNKRGAGGDSPASIEAKFLLAITALYAVPLPIAVLLGNEGGNLSVYLYAFSSWLPNALYFTSAFLLFFAGFYRWLFSGNFKKNIWRPIKPYDARRFKFLWLATFGISVILLELLANEVGGLMNLILSGYHVTELFIGQGHFAISFEWLLSLSVILMSFGIVSENRAFKRWAWVFALALFLVLFVMGRRGMLVVMLLSFTYLAIQAGWVVKIRRLILPAFVLFIGLNWLGLVRGESYSNLFELRYILLTRTIELNQSGSLVPLLFYTLTYGNFVVPFETLPEIMQNLSQSGDYWLGSSIPRSLTLIFPSALMPDRPLPLSNWYMAVFYGGSSSLNEGRQFFFLSEAYLNFGWLGCGIWGLLIAGVFYYFSRPRPKGLAYWELALRALFFGSVLNFVASDTTGFFVSFFKGLGIIPLIFAFFEARRARNEAA